MKGIWGGTGSWHLDDKIWIGHGTWGGEGGHLNGNWEGKGSWTSTGIDYGDWQGKGTLSSNVSFSPYIGIMVFITGASITAVCSMISYFVAQYGDIVSIVIGLIIFTLTLIAYWFTKSTTGGEWSATGTWKDVGEFRILDLDGKLKLGQHDAFLRGKMKDPKPK
jgi:hypothetical protein